MITAGFLGCGAGLLAYGMRDAGIKVVWGIDPNKLYISSFKSNFPEAEIYTKRIEDFNILPGADIWAITLPCQSFSLANQKRVENPSSLYYALHLIHKQKPRYYFFENVPRAASYMPRNIEIRYIKACQFGNKQLRKRMFVSNFNLGLLQDSKHSLPTVMATNSGTANSRYYPYINFETALERMGFKDRDLKLNGTETQKKAQLGEGVVYEMALYIGRRIIEIEQQRISGSKI